jgi:Ca-activated chloride channel family protein
MPMPLPSSSSVPASLLPTTTEGASTGAELVTSDGRALALVSSRLRAEAQGGIARVVLEQRFVNPYDETLRVTYRMPLPADGAVSGYEFAIAGRTIVGVVDRKVAARERFERALVEGRTAALLEQERADIFTQQIGNIPANEAVVARITIDQRLVWLPEGEWELRFPTVIGPRYIGTADTAEDVHATHVKVADRPLAVRLQLELAIRDAIVAGARPSSPSHALDQRPDGAIELRSATRLDRDLVVRWPVATPAVGLALATARPESGGDGYGLLSIVPPALAARATAVPRDLLVLLDTSGSMDGGPLDKAKQVVSLLIDSLAEQDRLELIEFSSSPSHYQQEPVFASAREKQAAIRWVRSRTAGGGTEMRAAVIEALRTLRLGAQRQVVVVTDGYVGGEQQILEALHARLPASCRLHVLGVGSSVNRSLATALARAGRGAEVLVGIDEDAERGAKRLLDRTRMPMLTNVEIAGSALVRHAPDRLPDVFAGAPLVAALALRPDGGELVVRGQLAHERWEQRITVPPRAWGEGNQAICALYGRERVADLESRAMLGDVDREIEELGLMFRIATRLTAWIAVDESRRVTGPSRTELIPQELPYGTTASAFGLRSVPAQPPMLAMPAPHSALAFHDKFEESSSPVPRSMSSFAAFDRKIGDEVDESDEPEAPAGLAAPAGIATYDDDDDDEFAAEEPTGQERATRLMAPAQPQEANELAKVAKDAKVATVTRPVPVPKPAPQPGYARRSQPEPAPALETLGIPEPIAEPVPPPRRRTPNAMLLVIIALLLAAIAALVWWLVR